MAEAIDTSLLSIPGATLIGLFTQSVLYGVFLTLYVSSMWVLLYKRKTQQPNWVLMGGATAMFVLASIVLALSLSRCLDGFVVYGPTITPLGYFVQVSNWKEVTRTALICIYLLVADGMLVYRCWVVWSRRLAIIALPCMLFAADIVVVITLIVTMAKTTSSSVFVDTISRWVTAVVSFTLAQNVLVTSLIVYRIWHVNHAASSYGSNSLTPVVMVLVESCSLYVTSLFVFLMTYVLKSNGQWIMVDALNGLIGIAFTMLIVRVGLGLTKIPGGNQAISPSYYQSHGAASHPMHPITISVNRRVDTEGGHGDDAASDFAQKDLPHEKDFENSV